MNNETFLTNVEARENVFLQRVYLWMFAGLGVTAVSAFLTANSPMLLKLFFGNPFMMFALIIAEFAFVFMLSGRIEKLSTGTAIGLFLGYSAITGVTFSTLVIAYAGTKVITLSFVVAAVIFAIAAAFGSLTKTSLKGMGSWLFMGLLALIIVEVINMFVGSSRADMMISGIGVVLFCGVTAWDSQKLMDMNRFYGSYMTSDELSKISILGALDLYLDFINIFLYLVRIFARSSRDN